METNKFIATIILLVVSVALFFLFAYPKYDESSTLQTTVVEKEAEYQSQANYYKKLSETLKDVELRQTALAKINSALPTDFSLAPLIYYIQKESTESGLIFKSFEFSGVTTAPATGPVVANPAIHQIKNVIIKTNLNGTYDDLKKFLSALENSARLFEVNSISFSSTTNLDQNQSKKYDFRLELETHIY